ncbi:hypothetical protein [Sphingomonas sp.]|uniref:hypothetical protein n=1 Tax=Sphingomonas sp. TaxID=28214 RepID=UPI003B00C9DC
MKIITLAGPTSVDTGNPPRGYSELRHPIEGALTVSDDEAERLKKNNLLACDPEDVPEEDDVEPEVPDDLKDLKLDELKAKALKDGVPLHDAKTKPTIIAAFVAHRASRA